MHHRRYIWLFSLAVFLIIPYLFSYAGIDARRKNATKESTNTLKAWLYEHRKNPYPTKGEKIMLAILTKMTLTQVSTWFANARRRLKKDNKVTWVTKDGDIDDDDDDVNSEHNSDITDGANISGNSAGDENNRHHGSVGDDDDNLSIISGGDRSEIDVEEHSEFGDDDPRVPLCYLIHYHTDYLTACLAYHTCILVTTHTI